MGDALLFFAFGGTELSGCGLTGITPGIAEAAGETGAFAPNSAMKICQTFTNSTASVGPVTKPSMPKKKNPPSVDSSTRKSGS